MFKSLKQLNVSLIKDTFIYTVTDVFGKAIGFILLPFVSYYMTPDELGIATNFSVITSIVTLLAGGAMVNAIPYFYYEQTKKQNTALVSSLLLICVCSSILIFLIISLLQNVINNYIKLDYSLQILASVTSILMLINNSNLILLRLENKSKQFALLQIIQILFHCLFVIAFVIVFKLGGRGKIYSEALPTMIISIIGIIMMTKKGYLKFEFNKLYISKLFKFGLPLLPHSLSFWIKGGTDKIFITSFCGLYQNGLYSMAMTIASLYTIVRNAFFKAYVPYLQKRLSNITPENGMREKLKIVKISYILFGIFFIVALLAVFGGWIILEYIVDEKYRESFRFVPWLIFGLYIYAIYSFSIEFIYKQKKTLVMGIITFSGSILQMALSYLLIKNIGIMGAVYSSIIGTLIISVSIFIYSCKVYPMPWLTYITNLIYRRNVEK